ncbi:MAG: 3-hydroxyacyl-CoA dehydrogenase family protein, partial [Candidatus Acidiferrum sp.]
GALQPPDQRDKRMHVKTIAVIGAGPRGRGIACAAIFGGFHTVLEDFSPDRLAQAADWIKQAFEDGVSRGKVDSTIRDSAIPLLSTAPTVEDAIRDADLIIEAAPEEMEMKLELFTLFDKFAKPGAIFASNTSSLSISDMTDVTVFRERCIGMRFFDNAPKMRLIELVRTPHTSEETVSSCREVARRMAKEVVALEESPGFVTTPINTQVGRID